MRGRHYPEQPDAYYQRPRPSTLAAPRAVAQAFPVSQRSPPNGSQADADNKGGNQRKRIAVACSRCRRRKIKCSGDRGDGQGCTNCKSSSSGQHGACQFLRVSSQDVGSLYSELNPVMGTQSTFAPSPELAYYSPASYYPQHHGMAVQQTSRIPRHYASNIYYNPASMIHDQTSRHGEPILDPFQYSPATPTGYSTGFQANLYNQLDGNQYYPNTTEFRGSSVDHAGYRYSNVPLSNVSGVEATSSFSSMDSLAHSLPGSRILPTPRTVVSGSDAADSMTQLQHNQPILKSQNIGNMSGSYSNSSLLASAQSSTSHSEATPSDTTNVYAQQQRSSLRSASSLSSNPFSSFSFSSSVTSADPTDVTVHSRQQQLATTADMGASLGPTLTSGDQDFNGQMYRTGFALDPALTGASGTRSGASSNVSSVQYTLASSNSSKRGSHGSLFATFEDASGLSGRGDDRRGSLASNGDGKKWTS